MLIKDFKQLTKNDAAIAGGKGASLGEMTQAGITVPPGFVVLSNAFEQFLKETDLNVEIDAALDKVNHKEIHTIEAASEKIQALILDAKMPSDIASEIRKSFAKLKSQFVAIRSSATAEDSSSAAWAGQLESFLNTTQQTLLQNVQKCWASLFTPRAIFYRFEKDLHKQKISVAVVVQKMVQSEVSGIAFSVHPVTQDYNQLIIEAGFGLGEAIVSGQITPDSYVVEKKPRRIIDKNVVTQERALVKSKVGKPGWVSIPKTKGSEQALDDRQILELSELILKIEKHYGFPCDIEWALEKEKFYIVQSRPITTLAHQKKKEHQIFIKAYTRNFSIMMQQAWFFANKENLVEKLDLKEYPYDPPYLYYMRDGVEEVWENTKANRWLLDKLDKKINSDDQFFPALYKSYFDKLTEIETWWNKDITNVQQLKKFINKVYEGVSDFVVLYRVLMNESAPKKYQRLAHQFRKKDVFFAECNAAIWRALKNIYPELGYLAVYITRDELGKKIDTKELKQRDKGFVLIPGIYQGALDFEGLVHKFPEYRFEIEKGEQDDTGLKGQTAYQGRVSGRVRIVKRMDQAEKVMDGEIIVSPMTTPDFVPAMKKATAFVTDEGGITCHAAIIAREMKKPCIIGTKIATQVLKDGDLVEVDADTGVVKILENTAAASQQTADETPTQYKVLRSRKLYPIPCMWNGMTQTSLDAEKIHGTRLIQQWNYYKDGNFTAIDVEQEWNTAAEFLKNRLVRDKKYLPYVYAKQKQFGQELVGLSRKVLSSNFRNKSLNGLLDVYKRVQDGWFKYDSMNVLPWFIGGDAFQAQLYYELKELHPNFSDDDFTVLVTNPSRSFSADEELAILELTLKIKKLDTVEKKRTYPKNAFLKKLPPTIKKDFVNLADLYYWIPFGYDGPDTYTVSRYVQVVQENMKKDARSLWKRIQELENYPHLIADKQKKLTRKYDIPYRLIKLLRDTHTLTAMTDERKEYSFQSHAALYKIIEHLGKRLKISAYDLKYVSFDEITKHLKDISALRRIIRQRADNMTIFYFKDGQFSVYNKSEADRWEKILIPLVADVKEFRGQVASKGRVLIIRGTAKVLLSPKEMSKLNQGDILVATMTTPEYVPAMRKSSAIITDEGGVTCHAAIVSRELNLPCVIGTGVATKLVKDGDLIEVDAGKGVVRVIKQAQRSHVELEDTQLNVVDGVAWHLIITRNMSFWHEWLANQGYYHHNKDFGVDAKLEVLAVTERGTQTHAFVSEPNFQQYKEAILVAVDSKKKIDSFKQRYISGARALLDSLRACRAKLSANNLENFFKEYARYAAGLNLTAILGRVVSDTLAERLKILKYADAEIPDLIATITYPLQHTPLFDAHLDLIRIGAEVQTNKLKSIVIKKRLHDWLAKHGYIPVNFCEDPWTLTDAVKQLKDILLKNCRQELNSAEQSHAARIRAAKSTLKKINDQKVSILALALAEGTYLNEFRKNVFSKVSLEYRDVFFKIARKAGSNKWRDCFYLTGQEMMEILGGKKLLLKKLVQERATVAYYVDHNGQERFINAVQTARLVTYVGALHGKNTPGTDEKTIKIINGFSANKGRVQGIAKVVLSSKEFHKLLPGEILVTTMTSVDFVPVMERAAAFVTNEGGVTSHASIVAREMNKPCIIGTKIATQVLKDGDLVEVDADKGIVKIIKRT